MILAVGLVFYAAVAQAQQHATLVMDARTGKIIQADNADTRVHPASLTKMMTLYIVFDQIRQGRLSLDQKITVSANAAAQPPSRLGLKTGQKIELRYLIRAAAIKSANDAASAMGDAIGGSEEGFARIMNQYARAMGLDSTSFVNANGLTRAGHMSTARDMAALGRRLVYDFPQYYNIFGRTSTSAGIATVRNTNRRVLEAYQGADGIKTGYTKAAGFNVVSSAQRGDKRVIVVVMGGKSTASRNAEAELLRGAVHPLGEFLVRAADRLADGIGAVVRRLDRRRADQKAQLDLLPGPEPEPRRRLAGRVLAHGDLLIERQPPAPDLVENNI
jgi:D-alanyl-D-alanine carboxypeptidase